MSCQKWLQIYVAISGLNDDNSTDDTWPKRSCLGGPTYQATKAATNNPSCPDVQLSVCRCSILLMSAAIFLVSFLASSGLGQRWCPVVLCEFCEWCEGISRVWWLRFSAARWQCCFKLNGVVRWANNTVDQVPKKKIKSVFDYIEIIYNF